ncbi:MAG TPA: hypothetical protein PLC89_25730 [Haliscomenobacter sp.]|uniref:hypothetical protein n=1 Tax=Haliscomenobacter sp. TaxID=2717303 RepID=UPI002BC29B50|nr:hypothetical protein [Haliscomenobacter sp.]HOY20739.1 hypothetical protein [Haliscomenobacter sp.]
MNLAPSPKYALLILIKATLYLICPTARAQSIQNIRDTFDQTRQLMIISYQLKGLNFTKQIEVLPYIAVNNDSSNMYVPKNISGNFGWIKRKEKQYNILWDPFKDGIDDLSNLKITLKTNIQKVEIPKFWNLSWHASNNAPVGFKLSRLGLIGFFAGFRFGHLPPTHRYEVSNNGELLGPEGSGYLESGVYAIGKRKKLTGYALSLGPIAQLSRRVYAYAGIGYGAEQLFWEYEEFNLNKILIGNSWALNQSINYEGAILDLGVLYRTSQLTFDIGISTVELNSFQIIGGIGIPLGK